MRNSALVTSLLGLMSAGWPTGAPVPTIGGPVLTAGHATDHPRRRWVTAWDCRVTRGQVSHSSSVGW